MAAGQKSRSASEKSRLPIEYDENHRVCYQGSYIAVTRYYQQKTSARTAERKCCDRAARIYGGRDIRLFCNPRTTGEHGAWPWGRHSSQPFRKCVTPCRGLFEIAGRCRL